MLRQETVKNIVEKYLKNLPIEVDEAILFGSSARDDRLTDSDVDLVVISQDFKQMRMPQRLLILQKNRKEKVELEAFGFTLEEFEMLRIKA